MTKQLLMKNNLLYKLVAILMLTTLLLCFTGCHFHKNTVRLASKTEALRYAKQNFGAVTYVSQSNGEDFVEYILKDEQYGFEYTIKSYVEPVGMDGSVFWYSESKSSNFESVYFDYIYTELSEFINENETALNVDFQESEYVREEYLGNVFIGDDIDEEIAIEFIKNLSNKIEKIDNRRYYKNTKIYLKHVDDEETIGAYSFNELKFKTNEEMSIDFYMSRAQQLLKTDVEYKKMEAIEKSKVQGLSEFPVVSILGTDNNRKEMIACYYFIANGKEYFITDVIIEDGPNNIRQHIYCITDKCSFSDNRYK